MGCNSKKVNKQINKLSPKRRQLISSLHVVIYHRTLNLFKRKGIFLLSKIDFTFLTSTTGVCVCVFVCLCVFVALEFKL